MDDQPGLTASRSSSVRKAVADLRVIDLTPAEDVDHPRRSDDQCVGVRHGQSPEAEEAGESGAQEFHDWLP